MDEKGRRHLQCASLLTIVCQTLHGRENTLTCRDLGFLVTDCIVKRTIDSLATGCQACRTIAAPLCQVQ